MLPKIIWLYLQSNMLVYLIFTHPLDEEEGDEEGETEVEKSEAEPEEPEPEDKKTEEDVTPRRSGRALRQRVSTPYHDQHTDAEDERSEGESSKRAVKKRVATTEQPPVFRRVTR